MDSTNGTKKATFTMPAGVTDENAKVTFYLGGTASKLRIDNIVLTRETNCNVDFSGVNCYPLENGDFEAGTKGWSGYGISPSTVKEGDNTVGKATGAAGGNDYDNMLIYSDLNVVSGFTYKFSFRAKANKEADITVDMEDDYYNALFPRTKIHLTTEWQTFTYETKFATDATVALKYLLAGTGSQLEFFIDDVVFEMKGAPKKPGTLTLAQDMAYAGQSVAFTVKGDDGWLADADYYVDDVKVDASKVTLKDNKLIFDADVFADAKEYTLLIKADGYSNSSNKVKVYGSDKNLIVNGNFDYGLNGWESYALNECADFDTENGYLVIHSKFQALDGTNPVTWSVQLGQSNVPVIPEEDYVLTFVGYSTVERKVTIEGLNKTITLTTKPQIFEIPFTPDSFEQTFKLLMGTVESTGTEEHYIYLDSFSLKNKADIKNEETIKPGDQLDAPMDLFVENAKSGVSINILPALSTPADVSYEIYMDGKLVDTIKDTTYVYETNMTGEHTIGVKVAKDGYVTSVAKEMKVTLADTFAPEKPSKVVVKSTAKGEIKVEITAPADNVGVTGYIVYLDGSEYFNSKTAVFTLTDISEGEHLISVKAYDAAGNLSAMSTGVKIYVAGATEGGNGDNGDNNNNNNGGGSNSGSDINQGGSNGTIDPTDTLNAVWTDVMNALKTVSGSAESTVKEITAKNEAIIPGDVLKTMKDKAVQLNIDMKDYKWTIVGSEIFDTKFDKEYNLEVSAPVGDVDSKLDQVIEQTKEEQKIDELTVVKKFEIAYDGKLPFEANLTLKVGNEYKNTYVHAYYFNEAKNTLEFKTVVKADNFGRVTIPFDHASTYILTAEAIYTPEVSLSSSVYVKNTKAIKLNNVSEDAVVTYKSSNKAIATVSKKGVVTGKKAGTATITTTIRQGGKTYTTKLKITVKSRVLKFNKKTSTLKVGKSYTFTITKKGYTGDVVWSTTNPSVATISAKGTLKAVKAGTVTVCATVNGKTIVQQVKIK